VSEQAAFVSALLDPAQPCPEDLRAWNGSDPTQRFAVYRNNWVVSLIDALAATFPVCQQLVGEAFFRAMARAFVVAKPPRSRILTFYGREFPVFIETFTPAASVPYLADVARLEMARLSAFHAADAEPLDPRKITGLLSEPDRLPKLRMAIHPSAAVLSSSFAAYSLWAAHQQNGPQLSSIQIGQPETALVMRCGLNVHCIDTPKATGVYIDRLIHNATLSQAEQTATASDPDFDLIAALTLLLRWQMITALDPGE
jgi:putative DNA-binding protein